MVIVVVVVTVAVYVHFSSVLLYLRFYFCRPDCAAI